MTKKKVQPSWERPKLESIHSPEGIEKLKEAIKYGLQKKYKGLAESMWRYEFGEEFHDMQEMSQDTMPEFILLKNGEGVWFEVGGQMHFLPVVFEGGINIYGKMTKWHPIPVGTLDEKAPLNDTLRNLDLNYDNSVIMKNDLFGGNDENFIDAMIAELVDNMLTLNQLQLLAKSPFIFNVSEDNVIGAKNYFLSIAEDKPAIFTNKLGEDMTPIVPTQSVIDPALTELLDRWECQILEYLGFPCVPITKRAQQTVSEVQSNDDKIRLRRMEKLNQREKALERVKEIFGYECKVISVIDEQIEKEREQQNQMFENDGKVNVDDSRE